MLDEEEIEMIKSKIFSEEPCLIRGKDQQIALARYSRLVVLFFILSQYLS